MLVILALLHFVELSYLYRAMGDNSVIQLEYIPEGKTNSATYKVQPLEPKELVDAWKSKIEGLSALCN